MLPPLSQRDRSFFNTLSPLYYFPSQNGTFMDVYGSRGGNLSGNSGGFNNGNGLIAVEKSIGSRGIRLHSLGDRSASSNDMMRTKTIFNCAPIHYREKPGPPIALASFPGSGNTWLRYLLQLSTGNHPYILSFVPSMHH